MDDWRKAQKWEAEWHGNCVNSLGEELKQLVYARKMGLEFTPTPKTPYEIDLQGRSVIDIGGGPYSLLLKCVNGRGAVVDPMPMPKWVRDRYKIAGITLINNAAENIGSIVSKVVWDDCLIYNCLQHTQDPEKIIGNAKRISKLIRLFEWIDTPPNVGHPQTLTAKNLMKWLGGEGKIEVINQNGARGKCFYGIFKGDHYGE